ncbi:Asp-tRNA(Asn)/Glu-tRNA(Gln) amidotransferase subunit GatA [Irregularibacter muris]|uniref:Glutamyl-tRNA(Gln) amidotransferase subunit A n=1 Tax=Irregularibacter muris TaxID=1796619 RepID=A0AAE3HDY3_9FIRM|nr:Asp-tRNA(Asn)/Glu-tRNA(Gln) amidotransferase subunit GatA [Irregularibacter muris]MCR1898780.1 Asp-tRNA(Asn)/Glu-tRNA(Gln) amidotransferase subunit GatA [Irregularibacter muris]
MDLYKKTALEIRDSILKKEITAVEVTKNIIKRIEQVEDEVKSFILFTPELALEQARLVDEKIAKGEDPGPLAGIPMALKDNICTEGIKTTCASKMLENFTPPYDATVTQRLREAGAILLGKCNMDEFAMGSSTEHSIFHATKNPWDRTKVSGGSSGGSSAAVAAGEAYFTLGTDTGGSVRQPASFCGVVGLKPTYGLVSRYGVVSFASSLDQVGTLTKDVKDSALVLNTIVGHDEKDSTSYKGEKIDYLKDIQKGVQGLKIGVPKEFMEQDLSPEVKKTFEDALDTLKGLGAQWESVSLPHSEYALGVYYIISSAEGSSNMSCYDGIRYGYRTEDFESLEELYKKSRGEAFGPEVVRRILLGTYVLSAGKYEPYYKKAMQIRTLIREDFDRAFEKYDVLLSPTSLSPTYPLGIKTEDPLEGYFTDTATVPVNLAGLPALSIPAGFSKEGLPIGLQLIGKAFDEKTLLQAAYAFEQATDYHKRRPTIEREVE